MGSVTKEIGMDENLTNKFEADFVIPRKGMICGSAEAEANKYHVYAGRDGKRWLVADRDDCGDFVYVEGGPNSEGFAGRTINFPLVDGTELALKGPWHTNPEALFAATGVDVRDCHKTFGVISRDRKHYPQTFAPTPMSGRDVMVDVIYMDTEPRIGWFNRVKTIAQVHANLLGETVFYYQESADGSSCGPVYPMEKEE